MLNTKFVRIILALAVGLSILPIRTAFAGRWATADQFIQWFGYLNDVCRDGMTIAVIDANTVRPEFTGARQFVVWAYGDYQLASATIAVTELSRPMQWFDINENGHIDDPLGGGTRPPNPYSELSIYYSTQKVTWHPWLEEGTTVVLSYTGRVAGPTGMVSDCLLGERNRTTEQLGVLVNLLPTGNAKTDRRIQKAVDALNHSLTDELWQAGGLRLTSHGKTVFNEFSKAVRQLTRIERPASVISSHNQPNQQPCAQPAKIEHSAGAVGRAITTLADVACGLARNAIEDAVAANGNATTINKADAAITKGLAQLSAGDPNGAIRQFKLAWLRAQSAMGQWRAEINEKAELAEEPVVADE